MVTSSATTRITDMRALRISILVPISPSDGYGQLATLRALDALRMPYRNALIATISAPLGSEVLERWAPHLHCVSARFVREEGDGALSDAGLSPLEPGAAGH